MVIIAKGAEGEIRAADYLGLPAVVKDRVRKGYREPALDERLRKTRTKTEARLLHEAKTSGVLCPVVYSVSESTLTVSRIEGDTLRALLESETKEVSAFVTQAGETLARLHSAGIAHGDYTPANLIVSNGKAWVIDFGLGSFTKEMEERAIDVLLMKRSLGKKEFEAFIAGYCGFSGYSDAEKTLKRLEEVEERGRYVVKKMAE